MDTLVIKPRTKADARLLLDLAKRIKASARSIDEEDMEDKALLHIMEERRNDELVSVDEVLNFLRR